MKNRDYQDYLQDILDSINDIEDFVENMTFEDFVKDRKTINAVVRSIEIIGEATKNLPNPVRSKYSSVPWKKMAGMRDRLIHEYFGVDLEILWKAIKKEIPSVAPEIKQILKQHAEEG